MLVIDDSFGSGYQLGGRTLLARGKHGAAVQYRSITYDSKCSCFQYIGPVRQLPKTT